MRPPRAIWTRYLGPAADFVNVDALVTATEMFTPADIEFAARKGAQFAFEREIGVRRGEPARTTDYLTAICETPVIDEGDARPVFRRHRAADPTVTATPASLWRRNREHPPQLGHVFGRKLLEAGDTEQPHGAGKLAAQDLDGATDTGLPAGHQPV